MSLCARCATTEAKTFHLAADCTTVGVLSGNITSTPRTGSLLRWRQTVRSPLPKSNALLRLAVLKTKVQLSTYWLPKRAQIHSEHFRSTSLVSNDGANRFVGQMRGFAFNSGSAKDRGPGGPSNEKQPDFSSLFFGGLYSSLRCRGTLPQERVERIQSAFNRNAYEAAIRAADSCIDEFGAKAQRDQSAFDARREPEPPVGAVSDADKQKIFSRGVLNDVGAAYFVKGRSAGALVRAKKREDYRSIATQAYTMAIN